MRPLLCEDSGVGAGKSPSTPRVTPSGQVQCGVWRGTPMSDFYDTGLKKFLRAEIPLHSVR